jgi:hypothetical protein
MQLFEQAHQRLRGPGSAQGEYDGENNLSGEVRMPPAASEEIGKLEKLTQHPMALLSRAALLPRSRLAAYQTFP